MKAWDFIPSAWSNFALPTNIQKRLYKFLLRKAIGQFLANELDLENFDIELVNGSVELRDLDLNLHTLNELLVDTPFMIEQGRVASIHATLPWSSFWSGDIALKVQGLQITLRPLEKTDRRHELMDSIQQSIHSSISNNNDKNDVDLDTDGLQVLTRVIDKMLAKIKVDVVDTLIRISHTSAAVPPLAGDHRPFAEDTDYYLDVQIPKISYFDETPGFNNSSNTPTTAASSSTITSSSPVPSATAAAADLSESSVLLPPNANETIKIITVASPTVWLRSSQNMRSSLYTHPTQSETTLQDESDEENDLNQTDFINRNKPYEALLLTTLDGDNWLRMRLRPSFPFDLGEPSDQPAVRQVDCMVSHVRIMITPRQTACLYDLLQKLMDAPKDRKPTPTTGHDKPSPPMPDLGSPVQRSSRSTRLSHLEGKYRSSSPAPPARATPGLKIKVQLTRLDAFIFYTEPRATQTRILATHTRDCIDTSNLRITLDNLILRHLHDTQPSVNAKQALLSTLDVRISDIAIDELVTKPSNHRRKTAEKATQIEYGCYLPVLQFDDTIRATYSGNPDFPTMAETYRRPHKRSRAAEKHLAVRLRVEKKRTHEMDRFAQGDNSFGQRIYDDLGRTAGELQCRKKACVRCAMIRIIVYAPDMSQVSSQTEFNDFIHTEMLSVDIKKLDVHWKASEEAKDDDEPLSAHSATYSSDVRKETPVRLHAECNVIHVFLKFANVEHLARCWFTAGPSSGVSENPPFSVVRESPNFEITLRASTDGTPMTGRPGYFGAGSEIPSRLFEHLARNASFTVDQKMHVPMEDQAESAMMFKQRTVETSLFVVNCHFPITRLNLTKSVWDTFQVIQNDLVLWQPAFVSKLKKAEPPTATQERLNPPSRVPSLLSLVAVMSEAIWHLHYEDDGIVKETYELKMTDFRYFTVVKHLGMDENITTLDIDDLTLDRIYPDQVPIVSRAVPKNFNFKSDTSMVSLFARLSLNPSMNKQNKVTSVVVCNLCWKFGMDLDYLEHLLQFQKVPDDMVYIDPPTQYNKIYAHVLDTAVDYKPIHLPSRCVLAVDNVEVVTEVISNGQPLIDVKAYVQSISVYLVDDVADLEVFDWEQCEPPVDARRYWAALGLPCVLTVQSFEARIKAKLQPDMAIPDLDVAILNNIVTLEGCADAFQSLVNLLTYVANRGDIPMDTIRAQKQSERKQKKPLRPNQPIVSPAHPDKTDMLASLDPDAFRRWSNAPSAPPPTDLSYVEEYYATTAPDRRPPKPRRKHASARGKEDMVRVLTHEEGLTIVEDFYNVQKDAPKPAKAVVDPARALVKLHVRDFDVVWKLHDGLDARYLRGVERVVPRTSQPGSVGSHTSTLYGENMSRASSGVSVDFHWMPPSDATGLHLVFAVREFEVIDNVRTSSWHKFLGYMRPDANAPPRERGSSMLHIEVTGVRPITEDPMMEYRVKLKLLPLRLYVDQDALTFLVRYFTFDKQKLRSTAAANTAIQTWGEENEEDEGEEHGEENGELFFQHVEIQPIVLKIDYKPKYLNYGNLKEGQLAELVNLFHLDGADIQLSQVRLTGINGLTKLGDRLGQEWLPHIMNTQVPHMVSGVSPIRSIVNVGSGVADLVLLPIQQYRKDGRVIRGIQRGTQSFARATAMEAIKLSARFASGAQVILEQADDFFSSNAAVQEDNQQHSKNLGSAAHTIFAVPTEIVKEEEEPMPSTSSTSSSSSDHKAVIRAVPVAVIKPMIGLTGAFQSIMVGLRNTIDPVMRLQSEDVSSIDTCLHEFT
ncbi:hypothetical protein BCR43DRAFT_434414 [Syncephalastrum racemosum]|uniref:Autophagy-related protein 2 n=1 Tax=Syncephalastrum racemosum TaxID=13706 RepID=A0A1X2HP00_SYNRA|nr:hypothetical protein BCR43DRAFT_434414 [Syncephalastrum racemosum]